MEAFRCGRKSQGLHRHALWYGLLLFATLSTVSYYSVHEIWSLWWDFIDLSALSLHFSNMRYDPLFSHTKNTGINLYHSLGKFSRPQSDIFSYFTIQCNAFHANCLHWRQFAWNVRSCFLRNIPKIFPNVDCSKFWPRVLRVRLYIDYHSLHMTNFLKQKMVFFLFLHVCMLWYSLEGSHWGASNE